MMYAVLDIETTGGQFNEEGITEIAIYKFDGHEVVDQFISLVNPEIPIQPFVVKLTGINNAMLRSAPKFFEVAKRIIEITADCILVAHNATFDYRILRTEFRRLGYDFQANTLCTVELAQVLLPDQPSYSLGKLVRALGIPMADRHRATGDALATVKLFQLLLAKDLEKLIVKQLIKADIEKGIEPKLLDIVESLPSKTGIYYVHKEDGTMIYIGWSKNIKKHVNQHFVGNSRISKKIQAEVFAITFEETGTELIAMLKEQEEIRINRPTYNRPPKRRRPHSWAIYREVNHNGFDFLELRRFQSNVPNAASFASEQEGRIILHRILADYGLCLKVNRLEQIEGACSNRSAGKCLGACIGEEDYEKYNERIVQFTDRTNIYNRTVVVIDRGRNISERSAVVVENGVCKGYAFFDLNYQIHNLLILKNILVPLQPSRDSMVLIRSVLIKSKSARVLHF